MNHLSKKIGILGNGMVGSTLLKWFKNALVFDVDPKRSINSAEEIDHLTEIVFICVPTPFSHSKNEFDLSIVDEAISMLKGPKTIIIKSTVVPGTTQYLQDKYPKHLFLFNPEFLTEKTALNDFLNPEMQIVGYTNKSKKIANKILKLLPKSSFENITDAKNAESIKYFRNCFYATKVVFANQFYDYCKKENIDYETVKDAVKHDSMISPSHLEIFHQGGRGAGGKCLAKDLSAFTEFSKLPLLKFVNKLNIQYLKESKK